MSILEPLLFRDLLALAIIGHLVTETTTPEDMADLTASAYTLADAALAERTRLGYT